MPSPRFLRVHAGEHHRRECPVWLPLPENWPDEPLALGDEASGRQLPLQRVRDGLVTIVDDLPRGETRTFRSETAVASPEGVRLTEREGTLDVQVGGSPFTAYHFGADEVRPYFYPLWGPSGIPMTRSFPMAPDVPGESTDHPHHRSLYVAFGEVNGVDVWSEPPHPNTGRIVHESWESVTDGPVAAELRERLRWIDGAGHPLLHERRRATIYATRSARLLDLEIVLSPAGGAVLFGDTKEGGPLAVRVASPIEGKRGGLIENAVGGRREAETWGKRAPWVDYSGAILGTRAGIAIMDHPRGFRHPTYWHVRDYGLFAANPFGISAFTDDPAQRGDVVLPPGETLTFRYRVCLHLGGAAAAHLAERYHDFAYPPAAEWIEEGGG